MINDVQFDDFAFQQAQRPFRAAFGRLRTGQGEEPGLFLAIEDGWNGRSRALLAVQHRVDAARANCCRTRAHIIGYVPKDSEIFGSFQFGPNGLSSARKSIRALSCFLAGLLPFRINSSSRFRSSALSSTT